MPFQTFKNFLKADEGETVDRWKATPTTELSKEMEKLQHNWTGDVLATAELDPAKAKSALDLAFPAGIQSDDDEFQDIMRALPLDYLFDIIGQSVTNDKTFSSNSTISGFNAYHNLTIDSGITLTLDGQPTTLLVTGTLDNNGTIVKSVTGAAGGSGLSGGGDGGQGGGGVYIMARILDNSGVIKANGEGGYVSGSAGSQSHGNPGSNGLELTVGGTVRFGKGGDGGTAGSAGNKNGGGGGADGTDTYDGGDGGGVNTQNFTSTEAYEHIQAVLVDLWMQNTEGRNPSSPVNALDIKGSGGGEGNEDSSIPDADDGGGGGGGQILVCTYEFNNTNILRAAGAPHGGDVGGGGGGGSIIGTYKTLTSTGTIEMPGGVGLNNGNAGGSLLIST